MLRRLYLKPAVPEFTLYLANHYYDVPATTITDPYSGNKTTYPGQRVNNITIDITIKNQPFTPYTINDPQYGSQGVRFSYDIRMKGHFAENWTYPFDYDYPILVQPTNSEYTVASYSLNHRYVEGQMDFQVEAMMGYFHRIPSPWAPWVFNGTESGWSNTQTITIPDIQVFSASTPAPTPTFSPTVTPTLAPYNTPTAASNNAPLFGLGLEQIAIVAFVIIAIVVLVAAVFLRRKTVKTQA